MRTCIFCPSTNLNREHIWSDWINKCVPKTMYTFRRKNKSGQYHYWQSPELNLKAKVVCKNCNGGWMNRLEQFEAKPSMCDMIGRGGAVSLLPRGIASIVAFAFKTSVLSNHIGVYSHDPFFTVEQRYTFRDTLQVPAGVHVWLFSVNTPVGISGKLNSYFGRILDVEDRFKIFVCTFSIGFLGIQLLASKWENPAGRVSPFPHIRQAHAWGKIAVPLFPNDGTPVPWPPPFQVSHDAINEFCNRWKSVDFSNPSI